MGFDRYSSNQKIVNGTTILSELEITFFDKTGTNILTILQDKSNKLRIRYGFDNNLSSVYELTILKINTTYNNMGCIVSIGAIAKQEQFKFPAEVYKKNSSIRDIIIKLAERNNWYIGEKPYNKHIQLYNSTVLPHDIVKLANESDIDFLVNKIKPIANMTATNETDPLNLGIDYFDVQLTYRMSSYEDNRLELYFIRNLRRDVTRNVWKYKYGASPDNQIIGMTNKIDQSFLLGGIKIQIPYTAVDNIEAMLTGNENYSLKVQDIVTDQLDELNKILEMYNLPNLSTEALHWDVEFVNSEDLGQLTIPELIIKKFEEYISVLNTIDLEVIGNPYIRQGDLIEIEVMLNPTQDPTSDRPQQHPFFTGYWKVITIREEIGPTGYTTKLNLVREIIRN